jgi:uncharacterized protein
MIISIKELTEDLSVLEQDVVFTSDQVDNSHVSGAVAVKANISHLSDKFYFDISFSCEIERVCGRCTKEYLQEVSGKLTLFLQEKGSDVEDDFDGEIVFYSYDDDEVDLREAVYEQILLETPIAELCQEDCKGLAQKQIVEDEEEESIDPRWAALKKLKK